MNGVLTQYGRDIGGLDDNLLDKIGSDALTTTSDERDKADIAIMNKGAVNFFNRIDPITYVTNPRELYQEEEVLTEDEETHEVVSNLSDEEKDKRLRGHGLGTYDKEEHRKGTKKGSRLRVGVKAQQVLEALNDVYGSESYGNIVNDNLYDDRLQGKDISDVENQYTIAYDRFIPFLIQAVKELNEENSLLKEKYNELENRISSLENN